MKRIFACILAVMLLCGACLCTVKGEETAEETVIIPETEPAEGQSPEETTEEQMQEESIPAPAETESVETAEEPVNEGTEPTGSETVPADERSLTETPETEETLPEDNPEENTQTEEIPLEETPAEGTPTEETQTEAPSAEETPAAENQAVLLLNLRPEGQAGQEDGIWLISISDETEIISFIWEDVQASQYRIRILDSTEETQKEETVTVPRWETEASEWTAGEIYSMYLEESCDGITLAEDSLLFRIIASEEQTETEPGPILAEPETTEPEAEETLSDAETASADSSDLTEETAMTEEKEAAEATNTVPAAAAKKTRSAGTKRAAAARRTAAKKTASAAKKTSAETAAETEKDQLLTLDTLPDSPVSRLTAGGEALNILLNEGEGLFSAFLTEGNALNLIPAEEAVEWQAEVSSVETLKECGITSLSFTFGDQVYRMNLTETTVAETESETAQKTTQGSDGSAASLPDGLTWCLNESGLALKWDEQAITWNIAAADTLEADKYSVQ